MSAKHFVEGGFSPAFSPQDSVGAPIWASQSDSLDSTTQLITTDSPAGLPYTADYPGSTLTFREDNKFNESKMFNILFTVISSIQHQAITSSGMAQWSSSSTQAFRGETTPYPDLVSTTQYSNLTANNTNSTSTQMGHFESGAIMIIGIVLSVVTGGMNVMVMVSFKIDKQLQTISNWFLFSLAVADALIGFISIPFMTIYTIQGQWTLGYPTCQFWLSMDYLMSNASVYNLLLISFDRYFSVTRPLSYRPRRTMKKALIMIASTYIISLILWPPWIVAWPYIEGEFKVRDDECMVQFLKTNPFVTVGTILAAFYLPVAIMILLYARVFYETEKRQRELSKLQAFQQRSVHNKTKVKQPSAANSANAVSRQSSNMMSTDGKLSLNQTSSGSTKSGAFSRSPSTRKKGLRHFFSLLGSASSGYGSARRNNRRASGMSQVGDEEESDFDEMDSKIDSMQLTAPDESISTTYDGTQPSSLRGSKRSTKDNIPLIQMKSPGHQGILGVIEEQRQNQISKRLKIEEEHKGFADMFRNPRKSIQLIEAHVAEQLRQRASSATKQQTEARKEAELNHSITPLKSDNKSAPVSAAVIEANGGTLVTTVAQTEVLPPTSTEQSAPSICQNNSGNKTLIRNSDKREVEYTVMIKLSPGSETAPSDLNEMKPHCITMERHNSLTDTILSWPDEDESLMQEEESKMAKIPTAIPAHLNVSHERSISEPQPMTSSSVLPDPPGDRQSMIMSNSAIVSHPVTPTLTRATSAPTPHKPLLPPKTQSIQKQAAKTRRQKKRSEKKQESKAAKTLSAILAAFVLTWLPYSIIVCIEAVKSGTVPVSMWTFSYYLCYINSTVNPLCYALCNPNFRATYIRILTCKWTKRQWAGHSGAAAASGGYRGR